MQNLVIVESPTKARTLSRFLGSKYEIQASMGHVRDLPKSDLGIDVEHNFEPHYIIPRDKTKLTNQLSKEAHQAKKLWLATDPDREGEAIAWHLQQLLTGQAKTSKKKIVRNGKMPEIFRVVFHEITPQAVKEAFESPRQIDDKLVDAQQARRVLDRLVGYRLSPLLWKKVKSGLSAGRVQSVALRLIVEREKEITDFKPVEYWTIETNLEKQNKKGQFLALLIEKNGKKLQIKNAKQSEELIKALKTADFVVENVEKKETKRYPSPPFTTSTLQQAANLRLGMSAKKTMAVAQSLYEHGLITYMRTDSFNLSPVALSAARKYISDKIGKAYLPEKSRVFATKSKLAQEAHEAIRPTDVFTVAEQIKSVSGFTRDHQHLYELIWKRMMASQMAEAILDQTAVKVTAKQGADQLSLKANGSLIKFEGWLKLYGKTAEVDEKEASNDEKQQILPELAEGEKLDLIEVLPLQHFTEPPPRYNEASLIKKLEELGIGRPSTYAPTLSTIQERFYVEKVERRFIPTELGKAVTEFLLKYFPDLMDYSFTAEMEDSLDEIANGQRQWRKLIGDFYQPFEKKVDETEQKATHVKLEVEKVDKKCPECGKDLVVKYGRFGKFLACSGFPDCKHTESFEEKINAKCPDCGGDIVLRKTKKGRPFYGCSNWPTCKYASWTKPKVVGGKSEIEEKD
ncbi:type I DNA topoisomerase [Patescibacteria group bacterium]|nr:type I DNA topoisomerase [Patescibacteria group bacterium]MCL5409472.1 type I DNA topoisomerase [Patescibacteria group bacterium]